MSHIRELQAEGIAMMKGKKFPWFDPKTGDVYDPTIFGGFSFKVPWVPSVNSAYANCKKGRIKSTKARQFESALWASLHTQNVPRRRLSHPMGIRVIQHADSARGDIDNGLKCLLDGLKKFGVIADDSRSIVKRITVEDGERSKTPWVEVQISCLS